MYVRPKKANSRKTYYIFEAKYKIAKKYNIYLNCPTFLNLLEVSGVALAVPPFPTLY
jgi:hypothetical protein